MRRFLTKLAIHMGLVVTVLGLSLWLIPQEKLGTATFLFSLRDKHKLLEDSESPRLIFVGGSNLSFGLDSERIARECQTTVINMGIHGGLGLRYMLNDLRPFIRENDTILIVPEYDQFVRAARHANGQRELVCVLFDVYPEGKARVPLSQWTHLSKLIPTYAARKLLLGIKRGITAALGKPGRTDFGVYDRKAFNEYGDVVRHWDQAKVQFPPHGVKGDIDHDAVAFLNSFVGFLESKKARACFLYPSFDATSYDQSRHFIESLDQTLRDALRFPILSKPDRYAFSSDLFFNTSYHLTKAGVDIRTERVIDDLHHIGVCTSRCLEDGYQDLDGLQLICERTSR